MKTYLHFSLFFLLSLLYPPLGFTQEPSDHPHATSKTSPYSDHLRPNHREEEQTRNHPESGEFPEIWPEQTEKGTESFQAKFFNMLLILALLVGFMIVASWALKRLMKSKLTQLNTASTIKVLETRHLSPKATLHLIEVGDQTFLIAESPTAVSYLGKLLPEEEYVPPPFPHIPKNKSD